MVECFNQAHNNCVLAPSCELQSVLRQATAAYLDVLNGVTLADLLRNSNRLRKLVRIELHPKEKTAKATTS
jgi:Rrf2 family nitric oxide-sensitive transcriptional repressor